ncbi:MAG: hypothetical protein JWM87_154 [Candidatus Eremiobacteraeota bacterium]|nr:hypothetical protein [Candidatus Eremiobacteraeota bacterium]
MVMLNTILVYAPGASENFSLDALQDPDWYVIGGSSVILIVREA